MNSKLISYGKITSFVQYKTKKMQKKCIGVIGRKCNLLRSCDHYSGN